MQQRYISRGPFHYMDTEGTIRQCEHVFVLKEIKKSTGDYRCEKCGLKRFRTMK